MSVKTYPLTEHACFLIDHEAAAVITLNDLIKNLPDTLDAELIEYVREHGTLAAVRKATEDGTLPEECLDVQIAMETLEENKVQGYVFASSFTGEAGTFAADGTSPEASRDWNYEDDFVLVVEPDKVISLFEPAYANFQELLDEFKAKLLPYLGEDFPYQERVVSLTGTYYC